VSSRTAQADKPNWDAGRPASHARSGDGDDGRPREAGSTVAEGVGCANSAGRDERFGFLGESVWWAACQLPVGPDASRFRSPPNRRHGVEPGPGVTWGGSATYRCRVLNVSMPRIDVDARARIPEIGHGCNFACRCERGRSCSAARASLGLRYRVGGAGGLVLFLSLGSEPLRARTASWALGSVERRRDPRLTSRTRCPAAPVRPSPGRAGRSCAAGHAQSGASTPSVGSVLGPAGDVAALAAPACVAALDVSAQKAWTATSRAAAAGADPTSRPREPALGVGYKNSVRTPRNHRFAGRTLILTPHTVRSPKANAIAERFVRTVRSECLDWLLILNRRHLEHVLRVYVDHYNSQRPHLALDLQPPRPRAEAARPAPGEIHCRDLLGGLVHEYYRAAA
jgi:putative transposase